MLVFFFFQAEDGIRDYKVTGVQTCALPILAAAVERALVLSDPELPQWPHRPRPRIPGVVSRRVEALRKWRSGATERIGLEPGLLLPNRLIGQIAEAAPRTVEELASVEGVRRWRAEAFGGEIIAALGGS